MHKTFRNLTLIAVLIGVFFLIRWIYTLRQEAPPTTSSKISVVATFYPLADFAKNVGGELVEVTNITPAGVEPHEYEPTPQDLVKIYNAKVFLMNGNGVDAWADKIEPELVKKGVIVVRMSGYFTSLASSDQTEGSESLDPHFWLDPINVVTEATVISDTLVEIDPSHATEYTQNKTRYIERLFALHEAYRQGLENCAQQTFITSHNAFQYLAFRFRLTSEYVLGLSPEAEPSAQAIANITRVAKENKTKYIFFETLVSPKLAQTIANEVGAQTLVLNPIEGLTDEELAKGKDYLSVMKDNLTNLRIALVCR